VPYCTLSAHSQHVACELGEYDYGSAHTLLPNMQSNLDAGKSAKYCAHSQHVCLVRTQLCNQAHCVIHPFDVPISTTAAF